MRRLSVCVVLLVACQMRDHERLGRPGDPGYVGSEALGSSRAHAGAIDGEFSGATFHVAYYEQPNAAPLIALEYGAYDAQGGGHWLHVALWAQGTLPPEIDLARYRARSADGDLEPAQVEFAQPRSGGAQDLRRAQSGRIVLHAERGHIAIELADLAFDAAHGAAPITTGAAEGDVSYECYRYDPHRPRLGPSVDGSDLVALPNPNQPEERYREDESLSSDFCRSAMR